MQQRQHIDGKVTRKTILSVCLAASAALLAIAGGGAPSQAAAVPAKETCTGPAATDPFILYGDEIRFDVRRNGDLVGSHTVSFAREGEQVTTATRFEVVVDVLFFTAYRYVYASQGTWRGGCLVGLTATTDDNGKENVVRVSQSGQGLAVSGPRGTVATGRTTLPTEHWAYGVVGRDVVINTITGGTNRVDIAPFGPETVTLANGREITARRYVYRGELDNEVWYDADGRWVKMRFPAKDGSTIEYLCVKCGIDRVASRS